MGIRGTSLVQMAGEPLSPHNPLSHVNKHRDQLTGGQSMINGISQSTCAFIPSSDSVKPERRKRRHIYAHSDPDVEGLSLLGGTVYPQTNECGNLSTEHWNVTWVGGHTYRIRLINSGELSRLSALSARCPVQKGHDSQTDPIFPCHQAHSSTRSSASTTIH